MLTFLICLIWWLPGCDTDFDDNTFDESGNPPRSLYVFGDSWADLMDNRQFDVELADRDLAQSVRLYDHGIGGTTAEDWATDEDGMLSRLLAELEEDETVAPVVFFTIGGNDVLDNNLAHEAIAQHVEQIVATLIDARSDVQIVYGSYDILNPAVEPAACEEWFEGVFGTVDSAELTTNLLNLHQTVTTTLQPYDQVTPVNAYGSLQGRPGNPDLNSFSPVEYIADCIHLNDDGHSIYLDTIFEEALLEYLVQTQ